MRCCVCVRGYEMFWGDDNVFVFAFDTFFNPSLIFPHIKSNSLCTAKHFFGRDLKVRRRLSVEAEKENKIKGVSKDNPLSSFSTRSCVIHIIHMVKADLLFKQQKNMLLSIRSDSNFSTVRPFLKDIYEKKTWKKKLSVFSHPHSGDISWASQQSHVPVFS